MNATGLTQSYFYLLLLLGCTFMSTLVLDHSLVPRFCFLIALLLPFAYLITTDKTLDIRIQPFTLWEGVFLLYLCCHIASITYALNKGEAIFETSKVGLVFTVFLLARYFIFRQPSTAFNALMKANVYLTFALGGYLIWELWSLSQQLGHSYFHFQAQGWSAHKNLLCSFLFLLLPFNLMGSFTFTGKWKKLSLLAFSIALIYLIVLQTRTVYIALVIGTLTLCLSIARINNLFRLKNVKWLMGGILISLIAGSLLYVFSSGSSFLDRLNPLTYTQVKSAQERAFLWGQTLELLQQNGNWLTGVGSGNWKIWFPSNGIGEWERAAFRDTIFQRPHNDFLWVWAETGLLGLLSYCSLFGLMIWGSIQTIRQTEDSGVQQKVAILLAGLMGYLVIASLSFPKERIEHQIMLMLLFASLAYYTKDTFFNQALTALKIPLKGLQLILCTLLLIAGLVGYHRLKGEYYIKQLLIYNSQQQWSKVKQEAQNAYSFLYTLDFASIPIKWYEASAHIRLEEQSAALVDFEAAYAANPYIEKVLSDLGSIYGQQGDVVKAEQYLLKAIQVNPWHDEANLNLAYLYYRQAKPAQAKKYLSRLTKTNPKAERLKELLEQK